MHKIHVIGYDYYLTDGQEKIKSKPMIRIYGKYDTVSVIAHVHGIYPYFLVKMTSKDMKQRMIEYLDGYTIDGNQSRGPKRTFMSLVHSMTIVQAISIYGYSNWSLFLKIELLNPYKLSTVIDVVRQGSFEVYEGHLSFTTQFVTRFGIAGSLEFQSSTVRGAHECPLGTGNSICTVCKPNTYEKQAKRLEIDILAQDIVVQRVQRGIPTARKKNEMLDTPEKDFKLIPTLSILWDRENERRREIPLQSFGIAGVGEEDRDVEKGIQDMGLGGVSNRVVQGWQKVQDLMSSRLEDMNQTPNEKQEGFLDIPTFYESLDPAFQCSGDIGSFATENVCQDESVEVQVNEDDEYDLFNSTLPDIRLTPYHNALLTNQVVQNEKNENEIGEESESCSDEDDQELEEMFRDFCERKSQSQPLEVFLSQKLSQRNDDNSSVKDRETGDLELGLDNASLEESLETEELVRTPENHNQDPVDKMPDCDDNSSVDLLELSAIQDNDVVIPSSIPDQPCKLSQSVPATGETLSNRLDLELEKELDDLLDFSTRLDCRSKSSFVLNDSLDEIDHQVGIVSQLGKRQIPQWDGVDEQLRKRRRNNDLSASEVEGLKRRRVAKRRPDAIITNFLVQDVEFEREITRSVEVDSWKPVLNNMWSPVNTKLRLSSPPRAVSPTTVPPESTNELSKGEVVNLDQTSSFNPPLSFPGTPEKRLLLKLPSPPKVDELPEYSQEFDPEDLNYKEPFFSLQKDVPLKPFVYASKSFNFKKEITPFQSAMGGFKDAKYFKNLSRRNNRTIPRTFGVGPGPPSYEEAEQWLLDNPFPKKIDGSEKAKNTNVKSQVQKPTQQNEHGFKWSQSQSTSNESNTLFLTISMELFATSGEDFEPNPKRDGICFIAYTITGITKYPGKKSGFFYVQDHIGFVPFRTFQGYDTRYFSTELEMIKSFCAFVNELDPDILAGYELHNGSWGYLHERAHGYKMNVCQIISRLHPQFCKTNGFYRDNSTVNAGEEWNVKKASGLSSSGRIFINIWRTVRKSLGTTSYTIENAVFHICHQRIPHYKNYVLRDWYFKSPLFRWRTFRHIIERTLWDMRILDQTETIEQTWEFAQVYGIDFFSVMTRGSQFRVESILLRISHPQNFVMYSPSQENVQQMDAPECLPLNMEPDSRLYNSPVLVLDFQSLYPSLMIAYNYCYSTCIGRLSSVTGDAPKLGAKQLYAIDPQEFEMIKDHVNVSPNGVVFVKPHIRKGILGKMVSELLESRVMIKSSMKVHKNSKSLTRLLNAQQLGIKLLANVTFGYTAASFSGRMPCVEISDAIIQSGRVTLERGIELIHSNKEWKARVVYGDTDSLFVELPKRTKEDAFRIGKDIVDTITKSNPLPIKLKFEKVYLPCILLTKKRYVGFMYENSPNDTPVFDAKGIETVRRDGCPAVAKIMENCLKIIFRTRDLSELKTYLYKEWSNIIRGNVSIQDFLIAKEVKLGTYRAKTLPPGAHISTKKMEKDERLVPEYGDRVPFVVVHSGPKHRLIDAVVSPEELINDKSLRLHGVYYITKQIIPPLCRMFNLLGADIETWFKLMPKAHIVTEHPSTTNANKKTIDEFYKACQCIVCKQTSKETVCGTCLNDLPNSLVKVNQRIQKEETIFKAIHAICRDCTGLNLLDTDMPCTSLDCDIYYQRKKMDKKVQLLKEIEQTVNQLENTEHLKRMEHILKF